MTEFVISAERSAMEELYKKNFRTVILEFYIIKKITLLILKYTQKI
jgi:hypothetical protein